MNQSAFDPHTFLDQPITGALQTHTTPVPEAEYNAMISKIDLRVTEKSRIMDVTYSIINQEELITKLGLRELTVRQSIFLDLDDMGGLSKDANKNIRLGALREAAGQNADGQAWFPRMLIGAGPLLIKVGIKVDSDDPQQSYNEVKRVTRAR